MSSSKFTELSPPPSPNSKPALLGTASITTSAHLPASPPQSSFSQTTQTEGTQQISSSDPNRALEPQKADAAPARTSLKHRLDDDEAPSEPSKRQRTDQDRDSSTLQFDASSLSATAIGPLFHLSKQPLQQSQPHPSQDLIALYGLKDLAASVARRDAITGAKINPLRKSYKGKIKDFPGKNETIATTGQLLDLVFYPQEEWTIQKEQGNEMERALSESGKSLSSDFLARLDGALEMAAGPLPLPEREKWRVVIDLETTIPKARPAEATSSVVHAPRSKTPSDEVRRTKRKNVARKYNDDAFEGYEDGFADDGDESDDRSSKKRRKVGFADFTTSDTDSILAPPSTSTSTGKSPLKSCIKPPKSTPAKRKPAKGKKTK